MSERVAVIGCGMFGAMAALRLAAAGVRVRVFERNSEPLRGASYNNQNRLHLGFHYPRDMETAQQCVRGFDRFCSEFAPAIRPAFPNYYFVAAQGSLTSAADYLAFCQRLGQPYERVDLDRLPVAVQGVDLAISCTEAVYDSGILRELVLERLARASVEVSHLEVNHLSTSSGGELVVHGADGSRLAFDAVVNTTYANINSFDRDLGLPTEERQYEYTFVPVIEMGLPQTVGLTIMDGAFMTALPFGKSARYLLYHVEHTVVDRQVGRFLPPAWLSPQTGPVQRSPLSRDDRAARMIEACRRFVPALADARVVDHLEGPRMVLARRDDTDARPSIVNAPLPNYLTVFSGKIDHCTWVADDIVERLTGARPARVA